MVPSSKIDSFILKVEMGVCWFNDAGTLLVRMLDEDPDVFTDILKQTNVQWITMDVLRVFEQIGRKTLAVEAMFLPKHVLNRLIELPVANQLEIATGQIPVVTGLKEGRPRVVKKFASALTRLEARAVIGPNGIRPPEEQASLITKNYREESIGRFSIGMVNNRPYIKHSQRKGLFTKVLFTDGQDTEIELVRVIEDNPT